MKRKVTLSLYWKCQIIGWSAAALYWGYSGYSGNHYNYTLGVIQFITDVVFYIAITHLYRNFSLRHRWQDLSIGELVKRLIPAALVLALAYTVVTALKIYFFRVLFFPPYTESLLLFLSSNGIPVFIAGMRLMSIWLLAYHLYHYAQREINIARENARLSVIAKDAQLNHLAAQLNPHFLFNSLNNIKSMVIADPGSARRAIDLLSDLLRTSLNSSDRMLITLREELDIVKDYLELEKMRFEERLQVTIEVEPALCSVLIPPLCVQSLAENAIKHGIGKRKNGGLITIKISPCQSFIKIFVSNPGKLDDESLSNGLGLKNLRERLKLQFNDARLELGEHEETVVAVLLIPVV